MPIRIYTGDAGWVQVKASFRKNWIHYFQEALGLAIFMISACFFTALLEGRDSFFHLSIPSPAIRSVIAGCLMGGTALFIFYSPWTSPSGSQINPAVTLSFLRAGKMCRYDAVLFIIFQCIGGVVAVYTMRLFLGDMLTKSPVNSVVTVPGKYGTGAAAAAEFVIAFITMMLVMVTSENKILKRYTRIFAGCLVCTWVIVAGPISGFGMNPARSLASALPAHIWTAFWIYLFIPIAGMLAATEVFLFMQKNRGREKVIKEEVSVKNRQHPYEFEL